MAAHSTTRNRRRLSRCTITGTAAATAPAVASQGYRNVGKIYFFSNCFRRLSIFPSWRIGR